MRPPRLSASCSSEKDTFPIGACTLPVLSTRNSILPALISLTARPISNVTVPAFGVGIKPRGPDAAEGTNLSHEVGRSDTDVEVEPSALDLLEELDSHEVGSRCLRS